MQPVQCTLAGRQPLCLSPNSHIQCCSSRGVCAGLHGMGLHRGRARSLLAAHSTPGPSAKDLVGSQAAVPAQPTSVLGREEWMNEHTGRAGSQASEASSHSPMPAELLGIKRHQGTNRSLRRRLINGLMLACVVAMWFIAFIWFPRTQGLALVNQPSAPTQSAVVIERAFDMRRPSRGQPLTAAWKLQEAYTRAERAEAGLAVPPWVGASASPRAGAHRQHEQTAATPRAPGKGSVSTDAAQYKLSLPKGRDKHHRDRSSSKAEKTESLQAQGSVQAPAAAPRVHGTRLGLRSLLSAWWRLLSLPLKVLDWALMGHLPVVAPQAATQMTTERSASTTHDVSSLKTQTSSKAQTPAKKSATKRSHTAHKAHSTARITPSSGSTITPSSGMQTSVMQPVIAYSTALLQPATIGLCLAHAAVMCGTLTMLQRAYADSKQMSVAVTRMGSLAAMLAQLAPYADEKVKGTTRTGCSSTDIPTGSGLSHPDMCAHPSNEGCSGDTPTTAVSNAGTANASRIRTAALHGLSALADTGAALSAAADVECGQGQADIPAGILTDTLAACTMHAAVSSGGSSDALRKPAGMDAANWLCSLAEQQWLEQQACVSAEAAGRDGWAEAAGLAAAIREAAIRKAAIRKAATRPASVTPEPVTGTGAPKQDADAAEDVVQDALSDATLCGSVDDAPALPSDVGCVEQMGLMYDSAWDYDTVVEEQAEAAQPAAQQAAPQAAEELEGVKEAPEWQEGLQDVEDCTIPQSAQQAIAMDTPHAGGMAPAHIKGSGTLQAPADDGPAARAAAEAAVSWCQRGQQTLALLRAWRTRRTQRAASEAMGREGVQGGGDATAPGHAAAALAAAVSGSSSEARAVGPCAASTIQDGMLGHAAAEGEMATTPDDMYGSKKEAHAPPPAPGSMPAAAADSVYGAVVDEGVQGPAAAAAAGAAMGGGEQKQYAQVSDPWFSGSMDTPAAHNQLEDTDANTMRAVLSSLDACASGGSMDNASQDGAGSIMGMTPHAGATVSNANSAHAPAPGLPASWPGLQAPASEPSAAARGNDTDPWVNWPKNSTHGRPQHEGEVEEEDGDMTDEPSVLQKNKTAFNRAFFEAMTCAEAYAQAAQAAQAAAAAAERTKEAEAEVAAVTAAAAAAAAEVADVQRRWARWAEAQRRQRMAAALQAHAQRMALMQMLRRWQGPGGWH